MSFIRRGRTWRWLIIRRISLALRRRGRGRRGVILLLITSLTLRRRGGILLVVIIFRVSLSLIWLSRRLRVLL
jgi:hypothetical protein